MTPQDAEKLAEDIKRVMVIDKNLRKVSELLDLCIEGDENWHSRLRKKKEAQTAIARKSPLMADIIRQLIDIVRVQHEDLEHYRDFSFLDGGARANKSIALSAPLMKEGV